MKSFTVFMTHTMRSIETVEAEDVDEAKEKAYEQSFENQDWEEEDTTYDKVIEVKKRKEK